MPSQWCLLPTYVFMTATCPALLKIFPCKNMTKYVENHKLSYYLAGYQTKTKKEQGESFALAFASFARHLDEDDSSSKTKYSLGLERLGAAVHGHTKGEVIGSQLAAHLLNGRDVFSFSHCFTNIPIKQALAFLNNLPIKTTLSTGASLSASTFDYAFRLTHWKICLGGISSSSKYSWLT